MEEKEVGFLVNSKAGEFNLEHFEELKVGVNQLVAKYKNWEIKEEEYKDAAQIKAALNKKVEEIKKLFKEKSESYLAPYNEAKAKVNEIVAIYKEASENLNLQIKSFDDKADKVKYEQILAMYEALGDDKDLIEFQDLYDDRWLNKTISLKKVKEEIDARIVQIKNDLSVIVSLIPDKEEQKKVIGHYLSIHDLSKSLEEYKLQQQREDKAKLLAEIDKKYDELNAKEMVVARFWVKGTKDELTKLGEYLKANNIAYGNLKEKE